MKLAKQGIVLYQHSYKPYSPPVDLASSISKLEVRLAQKKFWHSAVQFETSGSYEMVVKHSNKQDTRDMDFRLGGALNGRIQYDPLINKLTVTGYFSWVYFIIPLFFLLMFFRSPVWLFIGLGIVVVIYLHAMAQKDNYERLGQAVQGVFQASLWED